MPVINRIAADAPLLTEWRRDLHAHPELGLEEHRTSQVVAEKLASWGIEVTRGLAGTGLVGAPCLDRLGRSATALWFGRGAMAGCSGPGFFRLGDVSSDG